jgi:hypothetical protein
MREQQQWEGIKIYGRPLSDFLLPDQIAILIREAAALTVEGEIPPEQWAEKIYEYQVDYLPQLDMLAVKKADYISMLSGFISGQIKKYRFETWQENLINTPLPAALSTVAPVSREEGEKKGKCICEPRSEPHIDCPKHGLDVPQPEYGITGKGKQFTTTAAPLPEGTGDIWDVARKIQSDFAHIKVGEIVSILSVGRRMLPFPEKGCTCFVKYKDSLTDTMGFNNPCPIHGRKYSAPVPAFQKMLDASNGEENEWSDAVRRSTVHPTPQPTDEQLQKEISQIIEQNNNPTATAKILSLFEDMRSELIAGRKHSGEQGDEIYKDMTEKLSEQPANKDYYTIKHFIDNYFLNLQNVSNVQDS